MRLRQPVASILIPKKEKEIKIMAKKSNEKNNGRFLPKVGGAAVAVAMSVLLSTQVSAAEIEEAPQPIEKPPVDLGAEVNAASTSVMELPETNEEIAQSNEETLADNKEAAADNAHLEQENNAAAENNALNSDGALENPNLELPEAPAVPDVEGLDAEEYNEAVDRYNENVGQYNEAVDGYNDAVGEYNTEAEAYDQLAQEEYEKNKEAYDAAKAEHEQAQQQYQEDLEQHQQDTQAYEEYLKAQAQYEAEQRLYEEKLAQYQQDSQQHQQDSQAYQDYLAAKEVYDAAYAQYQKDLEQYNKDVDQHLEDAQAYQDYLAALAAYQRAMETYAAELNEYEQMQALHQQDTQAYQDYLKAKAAYDTAYEDYLEEKAAYDLEKAAYDQAAENFETEDTIFGEVSDYNQQVEDWNEDVQEKNDALEDDLHADNVQSIDAVGAVNAGVEISEDVLDVLNGYDELVAEQDAILAESEALDAHSGKNAPLDSGAYAEYLAAVEAHNDRVNAYNESIDAYNDAVAQYNAAVDEYNENKQPESDASTGGGTEQGTDKADWGNISIHDNTTFSHIDVKYTAAAAKDVTVQTDEAGNVINKTYSDNMTKYTVEGVYTDAESAAKNPNGYGVSYVNSNQDSTVHVQNMIKDDANNEFGTRNHTGAYLDPDEGKISFYVTLLDEDGNPQGITVNMDANSVYAEGTYFKAESNDFLDDFVGSDGQRIPTVEIDGETYYDISGQSVFVISALTCDGMTNGQYGMWPGFGGWPGYGGNNGSSELKLTPNGLDLVLNVQTMIEIHQSENAQKVNFLGYEFGMTAQAEAPTEPGEAPTAPTVPEAPELVEKPGDAPTAPVVPEAPEKVEKPGDGPVIPVAPEAPEEVEKPGEAPVAPEAPEAPERVEKPGDAPVDPGAFDQAEPEAPVPSTPLESAEKLEELEEKVIIIVTDTDPGNQGPEPPVDPDPQGGEDVTIIPDEDVPLADAPKTGDVSGLWAALSFLSLGGFTALKRKRKEENA